MKLIELYQDKGLLNKPTPGIHEISVKHNVPVNLIRKQLSAGIKVEMEHTNHLEVAREIALDHLNELPDYYQRLRKMEEARSLNYSKPGLSRVEEFKDNVERIFATAYYVYEEEGNQSYPDETQLDEYEASYNMMKEVWQAVKEGNFSRADEIMNEEFQWHMDTDDVYDAFWRIFPEFKKKYKLKYLENPILRIPE